MDGFTVNVNLTMEGAALTVQDDKASVDEVIQKVEKLGYGVRTEKIELDVFGMTCAAMAFSSLSVVANALRLKRVKI
jgi:P-type Cu+ transporter